jgi:hypothetical protein
LLYRLEFHNDFFGDDDVGSIVVFDFGAVETGYGERAMAGACVGKKYRF